MYTYELYYEGNMIYESCDNYDSLEDLQEDANDEIDCYIRYWDSCGSCDATRDDFEVYITEVDD